jgi:hypothetical protein
LPETRGECVEVILVGHRGQAREHIAQIGGGVFAVAQAGDDERVEDGGTAAGVGMPDKQPVLFPDRGPELGTG